MGCPVMFESQIVLGGAERGRTADLLNAIQALSQLSYSPTGRKIFQRIGTLVASQSRLLSLRLRATQQLFGGAAELIGNLGATARFLSFSQSRFSSRHRQGVRLVPRSDCQSQGRSRANAPSHREWTWSAWRKSNRRIDDELQRGVVVCLKTRILETD